MRASCGYETTLMFALGNGAQFGLRVGASWGALLVLVPGLSLVWRLIRSRGINPFMDYFFISGRTGKEVTPQSDTIERAHRRHSLMQAPGLNSGTGERIYKSLSAITGAP